jgi:hypothetical protein
MYSIKTVPSCLRAQIYYHTEALRHGLVFRIFKIGSYAHNTKPVFLIPCYQNTTHEIIPKHKNNSCHFLLYHGHHWVSRKTSIRLPALR